MPMPTLTDMYPETYPLENTYWTERPTFGELRQHGDTSATVLGSYQEKPDGSWASYWWGVVPSAFGLWLGDWPSVATAKAAAESALARMVVSL